MDEVVAALIKREQNGSTGFGKGVAVPHVKHARRCGRWPARSAAAPPASTSARWTTSRSTASCCCSAPRQQPQHHLQAMNIVFSNLQQDMFRRFLRQADTRADIVDLLDEADGGK